jgi:type II secretory ATPase GspE/PulE/Tfp pilus assembly ATPase PilB-like protein
MNAVGRIVPAGARRVAAGVARTRAEVGALPEQAATRSIEGPPGGSDGIRCLDVAESPPDSGVATLVDHAAWLGASDLFFAFNDNHVAVSVRHLGIVRLLTILTTDQGRRFTSYIKAMAGMDLAEQRRPLDGRWVRESEIGLRGDRPDDNEESAEIGYQQPTPASPAGQCPRRIDLRVSTMTTLHGEDMAIRLLVATPQLVALEQLGMSSRVRNEPTAMLESPGGLIVVCGPTGSGKTTTLYACLRHLNNGERKIHTIEDPIEYAVAGLRQSQINLKADIGFPELLRSVLRQSPDVILIGEIRDALTCEIAIRAANSGHLVLASVHAPSAPASVQSLLGLGASAQFLSSALKGVIAQRLVRTLCGRCKVSYELGDLPRAFDDVCDWLEPGEGRALYGARGCADCQQTGYAGRAGVFQVLRITGELRRLIAEGRPASELRAKTLNNGLLDLRRAALLKIARGETSAEEVVRAIPPEDLGLDE